jgi:hypothetical protein
MPASPSLLIVPARFKTGKLYTQIATTSAGLVLGSSGDFNVTRATTATRFNSAGLIESVASGVPRLDYYTSGGTAGCPALLVEPSAQNVALRSAGVDVSGTWQRSNMSVTTGITSPEGLTTAFDIVESSDVTAQTHELAQTGFSVVSGTAYTFSLFVKAGTNNRNLRLAVGGANFVGSPVATFNPVSGSVVASGDCVASVENYGNGWFRCRMTATADVAGSSFLGIYTASGTSVSYIGNGSGSVQVWGAQAEASSIPTSYIPTTAAAVTRSADVVTLSGAVSGCIGQTEGTVYLEVDYRNFANITMLSVQTASIASGAVRIENQSNGTQLRCHVRGASGETVMDQTIASPLLSTGINKIAVGYSSAASGLCIALNGTVVFTGTAAAAFTVNPDRILLGSREVGGASQLFFNNRIRAAAIYTTRLTDSELAALTQL